MEEFEKDVNNTEKLSEKDGKAPKKESALMRIIEWVLVLVAAKEAVKFIKKSAVREIIEWVQAIAIAVVLALVVRSFFFTVVKVDGQSMEPTLQHSDRMIVWRLGYNPEAGDIVIFNPPNQEKNIYWVKRVIATEGQTVKIDYNTNSVYVDGEKLEEDYLGEEMYEPMVDHDITEITVPEGCIFAMGDNRNHSTDSRFVGCIAEENITGKAVVRFWPFTNMDIF